MSTFSQEVVDEISKVLDEQMDVVNALHESGVNEGERYEAIECAYRAIRDAVQEVEALMDVE